MIINKTNVELFEEVKSDLKKLLKSGIDKLLLETLHNLNHSLDGFYYHIGDESYKSQTARWANLGFTDALYEKLKFCCYHTNSPNLQKIDEINSLDIVKRCLVELHRKIYNHTQDSYDLSYCLLFSEVMDKLQDTKFYDENVKKGGKNYYFELVAIYNALADHKIDKNGNNPIYENVFLDDKSIVDLFIDHYTLDSRRVIDKIYTLDSYEEKQPPQTNKDKETKLSSREELEEKFNKLFGVEQQESVEENTPKPKNRSIIDKMVEKIVKLNDDCNFLSEIIGQEEAKVKIKDILQGSIFYPPDKPVTFLFAGSTGVGKTETAKQLAKHFYDTKPFILDMSEMHDHSYINSIVGSPKGYIGYGEKTLFEEYVESHKDGGVIVLDEFEKADSSVRKLFLSVFDEGRLKTNAKEYTYLNKFIFVCTTNAGNVERSRSAGFGSDFKSVEQEGKFTVDQNILKKEFSPELFARTQLVTFKDLTKENYKGIAKSHIRKNLNYGLQKLGYSNDVNIKIDPRVIEFFADIAVKEGGGARKMNDIITETIPSKIIKGINFEEEIEEINVTIDDNNEIFVSLSNKPKIASISAQTEVC